MCGLSQGIILILKVKLQESLLPKASLPWRLDLKRKVGISMHGPGYEVAQPLSAYLCLFSNKISLLDIVAFVFKNRFDGK